MKRKEPDVEKQKEPILEHVTAALANRYHLKFTTQDVSSLWFLCKQVKCETWKRELMISAICFRRDLPARL